jgi:hypothetical protein
MLLEQISKSEDQLNCLYSPTSQHDEWAATRRRRLARYTSLAFSPKDSQASQLKIMDPKKVECDMIVNTEVK